MRRASTATSEADPGAAGMCDACFLHCRTGVPERCSVRIFRPGQRSARRSCAQLLNGLSRGRDWAWPASQKLRETGLSTSLME